MSLSIALHDPTKARANHFEYNGRQHASVTFEDGNGAEIKLFVGPKIADALVAAFNDHMTQFFD